MHDCAVSSPVAREWVCDCRCGRSWVPSGTQFGTDEENAMPEGTVVKYNEKTGTGLARPDDGGKDLFLHRDYLKDKAGKPLAVGERIRYTIGRGYRGPKAKEIEVL